MAAHRQRLSAEGIWIKGTSSARDGVEKVTRLVGGNRGDGADVCCEPGPITRRSLASDAAFLKHAGSEALVSDVVAMLLERAALEQAVLKHNKPTHRACSRE